MDPFYADKNLCYKLRIPVIIATCCILGIGLSLTILYAIKDYPSHYGMALLEVCLFLLFIVLYWWYLKGDLDEKFKWLLIFELFVFVLGVGVAMFYVFGLPNAKPSDPAQQCAGDNLYHYASGCVTVSNWKSCEDANMCLQFLPPGTSAYCINCPTQK